MEGGRRFPVGKERLTIKQISKLTGRSTGYCHTALNMESANKFVSRMLKREEKKSSNLSRQEQ